MSNRMTSSRGGIEDPLAGPSQPTAGRRKSGQVSKRKAPDDEDTEGSGKRTKSSQKNAPTSKSKIVKGEKKAGGLIINPVLSPTNSTSASRSTAAASPFSQPPAAKGSSQLKRKPPEKPNPANPGLSAHVGRIDKGKGKEREVVPPTPQDLEVDEDVRRMDEERERLRARDAQNYSAPVGFNAPFPPKKSFLPRRQPSEFGLPISTPDRAAPIDSTQPLPLRDTPTIDRNRAMRGEPVKRRSSQTMRGKRASNSLENTGVLPKPHASVSTSNFHKHIDQELPDAHRTRHLLVWCSARTSLPPERSLSASPAKNQSLPPLTAEGVQVLHDVQKEVQRMLTEKDIDISLARIDESPDKARLKEHPQNHKNRKWEDDFLRHIELCKQEDAAWSAEMQSYNAYQASVTEALARQQLQNTHSEEWKPIDTSDPLHDRELLGARLAWQCKEQAAVKREQSPLSMRMAEVENKADRAHSSLHISNQLVKRTTRHLNKRFEGLAAALAARSQPPVQSSEVSTLASLTSTEPPASATGLGAPPSTQSILRALARIEADRPWQEMGDAARRAVREVQRLNAAPGISVGGPAERRLTAVNTPTPRKTPGTPRRAGTPEKKTQGPEGSR